MFEKGPEHVRLPHNLNLSVPPDAPALMRGIIICV